MQRALVLLIVAACTQRPQAPTTTPPSITWHVAIDASFAVSEQLCWEGFDPGGIEPELATARDFARIHGATRGTKGCVDLAIDLARGAAKLEDDASLERIDDAVTGSFDGWLWHPHLWPKGLVGRLFLDLGPGLQASLPNERASDGSWLVPWSTWSFTARFAVGKLAPDPVDVGGARITITNVGAAPRMTREGLRRFVAEAAAAVATIDGGKLPTDRIQLLLTPVHGDLRHEGPVVFGMAMRGAGPSVSLRLTDDATDDNVRGEWIAVHELAHLWLPPIERESSWLSEGMASYYQCILRSRAGMYGEVAGWEELLAGFERGRRHASVSLSSPPRRGSMQTYWGGAAIVFKLDVALHKRGSSLDRALVALRRREPDTGEAMARIDDRPALAVLEDLLAETPGIDVEPWLRLPFADTTEELLELGVRGNGDHVTLDDAAPLASVRRAIAGRR